MNSVQVGPASSLPRPLKFWLWLEDNFYPIGSMCNIFTYIWLMCIINVGRYTNPIYPSWDSNLYETSQSFRTVTWIKLVWKNLWLLRELSLMCCGREKYNGYPNNTFHHRNSSTWQELMMNNPLKVSLGYVNAENFNHFFVTDRPSIQLMGIFFTFIHNQMVEYHIPSSDIYQPGIIRPAWCTFWLMNELHVSVKGEYTPWRFCRRINP